MAAVTRNTKPLPLANVFLTRQGYPEDQWFQYWSDQAKFIGEIRVSLNTAIADLDLAEATIASLEAAAASLDARVDVLEAEPKGFVLVSTATYTVAATVRDMVFTVGCTVTLPSAATLVRELWLLTNSANAVISASANVIPLAGGSASTAILPAAAGRFARLVPDGTNWRIIAAN